jgi:hypothetical protein
MNFAIPAHLELAQTGKRSLLVTPQVFENLVVHPVEPVGSFGFTEFPTAAPGSSGLQLTNCS